MTIRLLIAIVILACIPSLAHAATCASTTTVTTQAGPTNTIYSTSDDGTGSGGCQPNVNYNMIAGKAVIADPCQVNTHVFTPINNAASATTTTIVAGTASKKTYICELFIEPVAAAVNLGIVEGTGTNCSTISAGVIGGNSAATGAQLAANGGFVVGTGQSAIAATATAADNLCFAYSAAVQVSGVIVTVVQ